MYKIKVEEYMEYLGGRISDGSHISSPEHYMCPLRAHASNTQRSPTANQGYVKPGRPLP